MGVTALVMAGGRGTRMGGPEEKPLVKIRGKPMIDYILDALKKTPTIDRIIVAVTRHTPRTARRARELSIETFETPGADFVWDMRHAIRELALGKVLVVSTDTPFITSEFIEEVLGRYEQCGKPSLSVMVTEESYNRTGMSTDLVLNVEGCRLIPVGMNVIDGGRISEPELEQENYTVATAEIVVNVNTSEDLKRAEFLLDQIGEHRRHFDQAEIASP